MNLTDYEVSGPNALSVRVVDNKKNPNRVIVKPGQRIPAAARIDAERLRQLIREGAVHHHGDSSPQQREQRVAPTLPIDPSGISSEANTRVLGDLGEAVEKLHDSQQDRVGRDGRKAIVPGVDLEGEDEGDEVEVEREEPKTEE